MILSPECPDDEDLEDEKYFILTTKKNLFKLIIKNF